MDLLTIDPGQWDHLIGLLVDLTAAAGLALTAAFAFLLGRAVLPAFAEAPADVGRADERQQGGGPPSLRWLLDGLATVAAIGVLVGLGRAVVSAVDVLQAIHPRLLI